MLRRVIETALLVSGLAAPLAAQNQASSKPDSSTVVPGPQYRAGALKRSMVGADYRDLWTTPIKVPVLDLEHFAGGLQPTEEGGGEQTRSLRFKDSSGREYQFRSVDKDAAGALPEQLRKTFIAGIVRDQTSSGHPVGMLILPPLLEAVGILHVEPILFRMPDDPRLGQFREKFAGMLGTLEERPNDGFAGSSEVVDMEHLFERLNRDPTVRVESREYLAARLIDFMVGDWDRHRDQWRWARCDSVWRPIPRDRDMAFSRYDGFLIGVARLFQPKLQNYEADYPSLGGLTRNGAEIDRRLLAGLQRDTWDSVTRLVHRRLSDSVLAEAVRRMPAEFQPEHRPWLFHALQGRRDSLEEASGRFYHRMAETVELIATDSAEEARVERESGGATLVTVTFQGSTLFRRRFLKDETSEVRLILRGGADRIVVTGEPAESAPLIRIVGGADGDHYEITAAAGLRLYDASGEDQVEGKLGLRRKPWRWDVDSIWPTDLPRDRGVRQRFVPTLGIAPDVGVVFGFDGWIDWYGFRRYPFATRLDLGLVFATTRGSGRGTLALTRQLENSPVFFRLSAVGSGIESLRWYGFGNETTQQDPALFHRVRKNEVDLGAAIGMRSGKSEGWVGPIFRWSSTPLSSQFNRARFIAIDRPYGTGSFLMAGVAAQLELEARDFPGYARKGAALLVRAEAYPGLLDADSAVARVEAQGSVAFAPFAIADRRPSLHLMAGGAKTWGQLPFFLAPTLGGPERLRGYYRDRFAGEALAYGSVEVRLPLTRAKLLLPGEQGLFGFLDAGRVWIEGESSDTWHHTMGAGVWLSFLRQDHVAYLALARPEIRGDGDRLLFGIGFPF